MTLGGAVSTSRDFSKTTTYSARFDLENQFDRHNQFKFGAEFVYEELDMAFGSENFFLPEGNIWSEFSVNNQLEQQHIFKINLNLKAGF